MAQVARTTNAMGNVNVQALQNTIANIRARLNSGEVSAALFNDLVWVYNNLAQHAHVYTDYSYIAFGNTAPKATAFVDRWTSAPFGSPIAVGPASQHILYAPTVNNLVNMVNALRTHTHDAHDEIG